MQKILEFILIQQIFYPELVELRGGDKIKVSF